MGTVKSVWREYVGVEFDDRPGLVKLLPYYMVEDAH